MSEITADIVIAGGGTAGCVIAGRLSDAFPDLDIVVIENGPDSKDAPLIDRIFQVWKAPETIKYYKSVPNPHLNDAESIVPTGNVLGGGTCVNWLGYQNAAKSDFDDWVTPGWTFDELKPAIDRSIKYEENDPKGVHGKDGAMPVSHGGFKTRLGDELEMAFKGTDIPQLDDMADFVTGHGWGRSIKWIGKDGYRSTAARHYIHNKSRPNLRILTRKTVIRVIINDGVATSVEVCDAPVNRGETEVKNLQIIKARKRVVISAGALGTPAILERSSIGSPSVLKDLGIEVKASLEGVGREYQDHQSIVHSYKIKDIDGLDAFAKGDPEARSKALEQWTRDGTGILSTSVIDYIFKLQPTEAEVEAMGPDAAKIWEVCKNKSDKPLVTGALGLMYLGDYSTVASGHYLSICQWLNYPGSRGEIHISSTNPHVPPRFDTGMLSHPGDVEIHKWAYKIMRETARRLPSYIGEEPSRQPSYNGPSEIADTGKPLYSPEDEKALEEYIKVIVKTTWHSMATCPMKSRDDGGVVDPKLNVYGVGNLKLADLSICPKNVGSNTASVALIIGEKAAEIMIEELR